MSTNAARLNRLQIREQQELNKQRQREDEHAEQQKVAAQRRAKEQYSHVKGHGYGRAAPGGGSAGATDDVEIRVYVRECDVDNAQHYRYQESESAGTGAGPAVAKPRGTGAGAGAGGAGSSRPTANARPASLSSAPRPSVNEPPAEARGKVPKYLQQRKAEMAAEKDAIASEAERQRELAKIPPGHRLVSETEKEVTISKLDERKKELETELGKIPLRFDTQTIRNKRASIEDELRQIEATRLKYSTKKPLYIPLSA